MTKVGRCCLERCDRGLSIPSNQKEPAIPVSLRPLVREKTIIKEFRTSLSARHYPANYSQVIIYSSRNTTAWP